MRKPLWILAVAFTIAFGLAVAGIATAGTYVLASDETPPVGTEAEAGDSTSDDESSTDPLWEHFTGRLFSPSRHEAHALALADEEGVLVAGVEEGSALDDAGVVRGDIVLSVDGTEVNGLPALEKALAAADGAVTLQIKHGDDTKTVTVELSDDNVGLIGLGGAPCGGMGLMHMAVPGMAALDASATVSALEDGGPAAKAGIEEGERITALDGQKVETAAQLVDMLAEHEPGDKVSVTVSSGEGEDGVERDVQVTLGEHPDDAQRAYLGVTLAAGAHDVLKGVPFGGMPGFGPGTASGPVVGQVAEDSPAEKAGLEEGTLIVSVDGVDVATAEEVVEAIAKHEPGDRVTLAVKASGDDEEREVRVILGSHPDDEDKAYLGVQLGMMFRHELPEGMEGMFGGFGAPGAEMFGIPFGETEGESDGAGGTFRFRIPGPNTDEQAPAGSGSA